MKINFIKKRYFIMIFLLFSTFFHSFLHERKVEDIEDRLEAVTQETYINYMVIYNFQKSLADLIFKANVNQPKVIELFKNREREELNNYLKSSYLQYRDFSIRQLHFHLPNNDSFLRMHRPSKYGDNLTKARLTVKYVNENRVIIDGFEEGKIFNGFRFVYPLFDTNEHIGSVEISFSALAFIKSFVANYKIKSNFHISQEVVNTKVFNDEQGNYVNSPLPGYYFQKSIIKYLNTQTAKERFTDENLEIIAHKIGEGEPFSIYKKKLNKIITFIPLKNPVSSKIVATLSFANDDKMIEDIKSNTVVIFLISIGIMGLVLILLYKELKYKRELEKRVEHRTRELMFLNKKLEELAHKDVLTGIDNRRELYHVASRIIALSKREKSAISVAMIDIDNFKEINDGFGHDMGDIVLKNLAVLIKKHIRDSDVFVRYGGEEFVLLFPNTELNKAVISLEKIRTLVEEEAMSKDIFITVSIGVVEFKEDIDMSIKRADKAMYRSKATGKNRVCIGED